MKPKTSRLEASLSSTQRSLDEARGQLKRELDNRSSVRGEEDFNRLMAEVNQVFLRKCLTSYCASHVPYCSVVLLFCIVMYCIVLYCILLYCIALQCILLYCTVLFCIVLCYCCSVLYNVLLSCSVVSCHSHYNPLLKCLDINIHFYFAPGFVHSGRKKQRSIIIFLSIVYSLI